MIEEEEARLDQNKETKVYNWCLINNILKSICLKDN